jgi:phage-related protein
VGSHDKPLVWLHGILQTPPFSRSARIEAGFLLRRLQRGVVLGMPHARAMRSIGPRCYELRVQDENVTWRIVYRVDSDAIVILEIFSKRTQATPDRVIDARKKRLKEYDDA